LSGDSIADRLHRNGIASFIDISDGVAIAPTPFTVSPLTDDDLLDLVRTTRPTSESR
jgi:hypothetical protein